MKKLLLVALIAACAAAPAFARDTPVRVTLQSVLDMPEAHAKLDGSVRFFLAGAETPHVEKKFGEDISNDKTNAFNKTAEFACQWAALSGLIKFQNRAKQQGANAVIDIVSYNKRVVTTDPAQLECLDGAFVGGISMKGTYANVAP
jgi:opacity protein-like surface antigen